MSVNILDVAFMMQDKKAIQKDFEEASALLKNFFLEKYVSKLQHAIQSQQLSLLDNPPKEIQLLQVMKQFSPEQNHESIDKMIDTMLYFQTTKNIQTELQKHSFQQPPTNTTSNKIKLQSNKDSIDESIHDDGIYDYDNACLMNKQKENSIPNLFTFFALLKLI